ncbi:MAG: (Fe-S)-binding protein [Candidatus Thorarchaeota archaeon]
MSYEKCVRCGTCLRFCPLFNVTGEEQFSPRGKAYLLQIMDQIEKDQELAREFRRLLFQCTMCGRCEEKCSSDVDLLRIWHEQRARALRQAPEEFKYLEPLKNALANVKNIYGLEPDDRATFWLDELEAEIPHIQERVYAPGKRAEYMIFLGCLMSFRGTQVDVVRSLFRMLEHFKVDYLVMGSEEFCCGHPLDLMGMENDALQLREHNREVIKGAGAKAVVTCCPGCLIQLSQHHQLDGVKAIHHTQLFDQLIEPDTIRIKTDQVFAYHDPCELHRIMGVKTEPRSVMTKIGVKWRELDFSCCGGGGLLRMTDPNLSDKIAQVRRAAERLDDTEVLTCCPSCREQLMGAGIKTRDIVQMIDEAVGGGA